MSLRPLLLLLLLPACATITAESTQTIHVASEPAGATCTLTNAAGTWTIEKTPATADVVRSYSPLTINCSSKAGKATRTVEPKTRGRAWGNIALGGVPAVVDAATEKGYEYDPEHVTLKLAK